jgi:hypothetical protein
MNTDVRSAVRLQLSADPRLAAAAGGVVRYFADSAGLEADAVAKLQAATLTVCTAALRQMQQSSQSIAGLTPALTVEVTRLADRIEVTVAQPAAPQEKLHSLPGVDRIDYQTQDNSTIVCLTKNL